MESLPPPIQQLTIEMQELQSKTSEVNALTNKLRQAEDQLNRSASNRIRIAGEINRLKSDRQKPPHNLNNNLASQIDEKLRRLELTDLPNEENVIHSKEVEIRDLQRKEDQLQGQRLQQLNNTFHSLETVLAYVLQQKDYFDRYIWLIFLRDEIGIKQLNVLEFPSFTDQSSAKKIIGNFEKELSASEQLLTIQDKKDIDGVSLLKSQIANNNKTIIEMKRDLGGQDTRVKSLQQKLNKLNEKSGYPPKKLSAFLIAGLLSIVIGVLLFYFAFTGGQNTIQPNTILLILGLGLIIAGAVLLWLRYSNDKEKRLPEIKQKLENATGQFSRNTQELRSLEQKSLQDNNQLAEILNRRPILHIMNDLT
jgi:hypothetical protein